MKIKLKINGFFANYNINVLITTVQHRPKPAAKARWQIRRISWCVFFFVSVYVSAQYCVRTIRARVLVSKAKIW